MADSSPEQSSSDDWIVVGTVMSAHGVDGRVRIEPDTDNPDRFASGSKLRIADRDFVVDSTGPGAGGTALLVKLEGLDVREEAQELAHEPVYVHVSEVPPLPEGEYYHYQLIDMQVVDAAGETLGTLTEIIVTGANNVYVVTGESSELLLPAIPDVIVDVDVDAKRMTVAVPEGIEPRSLTPAKKKRPLRKRRPPKRPRSS